MFDYCVIGGGVVGAFVLSKLTEKDKKCLLIEKALDVATGATKANSALIHAGFDALPTTLKAKLNVEGAKQFPRVCKRLFVPFKRIGSVVVGNDEAKLAQLLERGKENRVKHLSLLNTKKLHKLIPTLSKNLQHALYAKSSGIVSPYLLTIALCEEAIINSAKIIRGCNITNITKGKDHFTITDNNNYKYDCEKIVICCGAGHNEIAHLLGSQEYDLVLKRGEYYVLDNTSGGFVKTTVFPLPTEKGKGILATPTIDGNVLFGPTSSISEENNTKTTSIGLNEIKASISEMFEKPPFFSAIREYSGIRVGCGQDFVIEKDSKVPNVINVVGINSPGLSSAPAIADMVLSLFGENGKSVKLKKRKPIPDISKMSLAKRNRFIQKNPEYGNIICRCELVSEGEIKACLSSPLPPLTVDGVKRRVRAGMGRCQGSFCGLKVAKLISESNNIPITKICKENTNGFVMPFEIKQTKGGDGHEKI